MDARLAGADDLATVVATISSAFHECPTWSWAFPDPALRQSQYYVFWSFFIAPAVRQGGVWMTPGGETATVWIPPGGEEMSEADEEQVPIELRRMLGSHAEAVIELLERFDAAHPRERDHWYLTLFGTHADHRGKGLGMALLAENLERFDREGVPTYLESSNPANDCRYEALGYERIGSIAMPNGSHTIATMWREPRDYS